MKNHIKPILFGHERACLLLLPLFLLINADLFAQTGQPVVVGGSATNGFNLGHPSQGTNAVAIDKQGNTYYTGGFTGTVDFDPGPGVVARTNSYTAGSVIYLAKYNIDGSLVWVNIFGSDKISSTYSDIGIGVKTDGANNVYIACNIYGTVDFDPSAATANVVGNTGNSDGVLAKYNSSGNFQWALNVGGASSTSDAVTSMDVDKDNNVYISGTFTPNTGAKITDGAGSVFLLPTTGSTTPYILKIAPGGVLSWNKYATPPVGGATLLVQCAVNASGDVYVTGTAVASTVFNAGSSNPITIPAVTGTTDGYIWKLNSAGENVYVKQFEALSVYIALDTNGSPIITGNYQGASQDLDPGSSSQNLKTSLGSNDVYLARLNPADASAVWVITANGTGNDQGLRVAVNGTDIYAGINFASASITFPLEASTVALGNLGGDDVAIWKVTTDGTVKWVNRIAGTGADAVRGLAIYNGTLRVGALVRGQADLDPGTGSLNTPTNAFPSLAAVTWAADGTLGTAVALPINLLAFDAKGNLDNSVLISWKTAQEVNNSHFILEKSSDSRNFSFLAKINGKGTYTAESSYSFLDVNASSGKKYYRLKQYDLDGHEKDYGIRLVISASDGFAFKVAPNPAVGNSLKFSFNNLPNNTLTYTIVDIKGQTMKEGKIISPQQTFDITTLAPGQYIIQLNNGKSLKFQRN